MIVGAIFSSRMVKLARRMAVIIVNDAERSGHAEMHQEHVAGGEVGHQIFGASAQTGHGLTLQPRDKILLERKPQVLAPDFGLHDFGTFHGRLQAAANGLDFR